MYLIALLLLFLPAAGTPPPADQAFAAKCGVTTKQPLYLFYEMNNDRWTKYADWKGVPEPGEQDQLLTAYRAADGSLYTMRSVPGEQFSAEQHDCYSPKGKLRFVHFAGNAQAWSYSEDRDYSTAQTKIAKVFTDGKSHKTIKRPADADKLGDDLAPKLYLRIEQAPYAGFVSAAKK